MKTLYRMAADLLLGLHFVVGAFFLAGWLFRAIQLLYLPILISWPLCWIFLGYCPLTRWEILLRKKYNPEFDTHEEFIKRYAHKFFQMDIHSQTVFQAGLVIFTILLALSLVHTSLF